MQSVFGTIQVVLVGWGGGWGVWGVGVLWGGGGGVMLVHGPQARCSPTLFDLKA